MEGLLDTFGLTAWAERVGAVTISRELLHALALQAALIAALYAAAWGIRVLTRPWTDRLADRVQHRLRATHIPKHICGLATLCFAWLLLVTAHRTALRFGIEWPLVGIAASLTALWIVLRASTLLFSDLLLARTIATIAWFLIALDLLGLLGPAAAALDSAAITFGYGAAVAADGVEGGGHHRRAAMGGADAAPRDRPPDAAPQRDQPVGAGP